MKQLLFLIAFLSAVFVSNAQFGKAAVFPTLAGDTLNNVDTVTKVITATAGYNASGIQVNLKKISGTVAGKAYLYQSLDGVTYSLTDSAVYSPVPTWSMTTTPYTHVAQFAKVTTPSVYYLVNSVSSGTVSAVVQVIYTLRKLAVTY